MFINTYLTENEILQSDYQISTVFCLICIMIVETIMRNYHDDDMGQWLA